MGKNSLFEDVGSRDASVKSEGFTAFLERLFPAQSNVENFKLGIAENLDLLMRSNGSVNPCRVDGVDVLSAISAKIIF
jgi:hypothetical protein